MCPHGYHHSGSMAIHMHLGSRDVRLHMCTGCALTHMQVEAWNYRACLSVLTQSCPVSPGFATHDLLIWYLIT